MTDEYCNDNHTGAFISTADAQLQGRRLRITPIAGRQLPDISSATFPIKNLPISNNIAKIFQFSNNDYRSC